MKIQRQVPPRVYQPLVITIENETEHQLFALMFRWYLTGGYTPPQGMQELYEDYFKSYVKP